MLPSLRDAIAGSLLGTATGDATLVMGGVCHWVATAIVARAGTATLLGRLAAVALPIAAGVATLAAVLWMLRAPELQLFTRVLRLRRRQPPG